METLGKVTNGAILLSSLVVGVVGVVSLVKGVKMQSGSAIVFSSLVVLVGIYAFNEARQKLND